MPIGRLRALANRCIRWSSVSRRRQTSSGQARVSSYEEENATGSVRNASRRMARTSRQSRGPRTSTYTPLSSPDIDEEILFVESLEFERNGQSGPPKRLQVLRTGFKTRSQSGDALNAARQA